MTPRTDLRTNALQNILDAETLLKNGSHKNACNQAALGVEMMLKVRLCRVMNWSHYPSSHSEARTLNAAAGLAKDTKLLIHDLDALMTLNESNSIFTRDSLHVEWPSVGDWGIENRYSPDTIISIEDAEVRISESAKVVRQLFDYERCFELLNLESELVRKFGLAYLFAVLKDDEGNYSLMISPSVKDKEHVESIVSWLKDSIDKIDPDLIYFSKWQFENPNSEITTVCTAQSGKAGSLHFVRGNMVVGYDYVAEGLIITAARWTEEQVHESWENATEVDFVKTTEPQ